MTQIGEELKVLRIVATKLKISAALKTIIALTTAAFLSACSTVQEVKHAPDGVYKTSLNKMPYAAAAPLRDLNIGMPDIPAQLLDLQNPYGVDTLTSCAAILAEAQSLDASLAKADTDQVGTRHTDKTRAGKLGNAADATAKAITTSIIPFRGVVRLASGATKTQKRLDDADKAGRERLGFLIGIGSAKSCPGFNLHIPPLR